MPEDYDPNGLIKPKPSVAQQVKEGLFSRNPFLVIVPPLEFLRDESAPYVTYPITGVPPGGNKPTGVPPVAKKILEDVGALILPGRFLKALTEIGEGQIPLVEKSGNRFGLGSGEEQVLAADRERRRLATLPAPRPNLLFGFIGGSGAAGVNLAGATPIFGTITGVAAGDANSVLNNMRRGNVGADSDDPTGLVAQTGDP